MMIESSFRKLMFKPLLFNACVENRVEAPISFILILARLEFAMTWLTLFTPMN